MIKLTDIKRFFMFLVIAAFSLILGIKYSNAPQAASPKKDETVYERVMRTGTLRCGYFEEPPFTVIDPNTGKRSGIAVELAQRLADELNLKLEWVEAVNFTALTQDLANGRYDAICASVFNLPRAGRIAYTMPYVLVPVYGYARADVTSYDDKMETLDWSGVTIAGIDGEGATTIARKKLPGAKFSILPPMSQIAEMLTSVATKKADIAFVLPTVYADYEKNNPGVLRRVENDRPLYTYAVSFAIKPDEAGFKDMLDMVIRQMIVSGEMDALIDRYDPQRAFFRVHPD